MTDEIVIKGEKLLPWQLPKVSRKERRAAKLALTSSPRPDGVPKAYVYCRVSTAKQVDKSGIGDQKARGRSAYDAKLAKTHDWGGYVVEEAVSGEVPFEKRPAGKWLTNELRRMDALIVPMVDRLGRNMVEGIKTVLRLHAEGVHLLVQDIREETLDLSDPIHLCFLTFYLAGAEDWLHRHRKRVKAGMAEGRRKGHKQGGCKQKPYPFRKMANGKWEVDEGWREYARLCLALITFGEARGWRSKDCQYQVVMEQHPDRFLWYYRYAAYGPKSERRYFPQIPYIRRWATCEAALQKAETGKGIPFPPPVVPFWDTAKAQGRVTKTPPTLAELVAVRAAEELVELTPATAGEA